MMARDTWKLLEKEIIQSLPAGEDMLMYVKAYSARYKDYWLVPEAWYVCKQKTD
jgi:hypothetical protein